MPLNLVIGRVYAIFSYVATYELVAHRRWSLRHLFVKTLVRSTTIYVAFLIGIICAFGGEAYSKSLESEKTYFDLNDFSYNEHQNSDCYQAILHQLCLKMVVKLLPDGGAVDCENPPSNPILEGSADHYSRYHLSTKGKTNTVLITIHGLWGDSDQFSYALNQIIGYGPPGKVNVIELTLPGHLKTDFGDSQYWSQVKTHPPFATYDKWLRATEDTLKIARRLGDHTIVIGQSTGGLLAVYAAIKDPELLDEIVLFEPALKVKGMVNWGACESAHLPRWTLKSLAFVAGTQIPTGVDVRMGCEVQKLASLIFPSRHSSKQNKAKSEPKYRYENHGIYSEISKNIRVPVFMINNEADHIVSAKANKEFYGGLGKAKYLSASVVGAVQHGNIGTLAVHAREIISFTREFLPSSNLGDFSYYNLAHDLKLFTLLDPCVMFSRDQCKQLVPDTYAKKDRFASEACAILPTECETIQTNLNFIDQNRGQKNSNVELSNDYIESIADRIYSFGG